MQLSLAKIFIDRSEAILANNVDKTRAHWIEWYIEKMNSCTLDHAGEKTLFFWDEDLVGAEGYDLVSERIALILAGGRGEGIGVLLVAVNDCRERSDDPRALLKGFEKGMLENKAPGLNWGSLNVWEYKLAYEYLSFSPDKIERWKSAACSGLSVLALKRLAGDSSLNVLVQLAERNDLPGEILLNLATHQHSCVRGCVAHNIDTPLDILQNLSRDEDNFVRCCVASNPQCSRAILEILALDEHEEVSRKAKTRRYDSSPSGNKWEFSKLVA